MRCSYRSTSLVAAVVGAFILALTQPPIAEAAAKAATSQTLSISSGQLITFASTTQTFANTGVALSASIANGTPKTFFINNSGTIGVTAFAFIVTLPSTSNVSYFKRCALNVAFVGNNSCASGSAVTVAMTPGISTSYVLSLPANSFYSYQIVQNKGGTMVVNTFANISHAVTGTTNS
jgi:hypothetical protein